MIEGKAAVLGVGLTPFGKHEDRTVEDLARAAVVAALADAALGRNDIQAVFAAHLYQGEVLGQRVLRGLGFPEVPVLNLENACAGGSSAVRAGWLAVAAGQYDVVLVIGAEKMGRGLISFVNPDLEQAMGITAPAQYALAARRHMHEFGTPVDAFAEIAVKSRYHAGRNPNAWFRDPVTRQEVLASRPIAEPLTLLQCCRNGSGAAAVVLASKKWAGAHGRGGPWIRTSALASWMSDGTQKDLTDFGATRRAAAEVYDAAGIGPDEIDVVELHDAFTCGELLHYEGLQLCAKGEGAHLALDGATRLGGRVPVNVSGGLLAKSHPLGATGVAQFCELTWQLRGTATGRQVEGARVALAHSQGGINLEAGATCVTLLTRD